MIKVCHVVSGLRSGGVESMIYNYTSHMKKDFEWHVLYQHQPSKKNIDEFAKLGFNLKRIPSKIKHPIKNYKATYKYLKENNIEVVHCHMTLMNIFPLIAAKKCNIKIRISHSHNSDVQDKNILIKLFEHILKVICNRYSTINIACGKDAGEYMFLDNKYYILNNALDLEKYKYNINFRNEIRTKYMIKDNEILLGHIGRFTYQKNQEFLLDLINKLPSKYKLMMVGDGENFENINKIIIDRNLKDRVVLTGIVNNTNEFYSSFDLFVLPSRWEGLPVVGLEAQANGLYSVMSNNIDKNVNIINKVDFLNIDNIDKWVEVINFIINSKKNINREQDTALFDINGINIEIEADKLEKIYLGKE